MDLERWTKLETCSCSKAGTHVAIELSMNGLYNPDPGPEFTDVTSKLNKCTGVSRCGLVLPATSADLVRAECPVAELIRKKFGIHPRPQLVEE